MKKEDDYVFWSDRIANLLVNRKKYNYVDKPVKKTSTFNIKSSTSISGVPHIGNASDVLRADSVVRSLKDLGKKVKFIWVAEDMDPLRKVPAGIPKEFKKYIGMPVANLPCPFGCCDSYVKHFVNLFIKSLHENFGTSPKMLTTSDAYKNGEFYPYVKKAIESTDAIKNILNKHRTNPLPSVWNPWKPVCENCGKLITTNILSADKNSVRYKCEDYSFQEFGKDAYNKVDGCGHIGDSDIKKGNGKLLWKIEWAAEWKLWDIHFEPAGKEHFMPGAAFWNAGEVSEHVYDWPEPYPGRNEIQPYEYIMLGDAKMSASKGNVVATWEWPEFAPPEVLRLIFLKRPNMQRGFSFTKIPDLVDELDRMKEIYYGKKKLDSERDSVTLKRLYEMCMINPEVEYTPNVPFSFASMLVQTIPDATTKNFDRVVDVLKKSGIENISSAVKRNIISRMEQARVWVDKYGEEKDRIVIAQKIPPESAKLSESQRNSLSEIGDLISKERNDSDVLTGIRDIAKNNRIETKDLFQAAYTVLIGKDYGPRLVPFIQSLDKEFVVKRLKLEA